MCRVSFAVCSDFQQLTLSKTGTGLRQNFRNFKFTFGQCTCFIKDNCGNLGNSLEEVASFYQNTDPGSSTDSAEEAKRNGDDKCTGAGDNQENAGSLYPCRKSAAQKKRRQKGKNCSTDRDHRGIVSGKARDEVFKSCFLTAGVLHQFQNLGNSGILIGLCHTYLERTVSVDTAADDIVTGSGLTRNGFSGERCSINKGFTFSDHTVQRNLFTGTDDDDAAYSDFIRIYLLDLSVFFKICIFRSDTHHFCNGLAGFADGVALEEFTDLVKEHNGKCF